MQSNPNTGTSKSTKGMDGIAFHIKKSNKSPKKPGNVFQTTNLIWEEAEKAGNILRLTANNTYYDGRTIKLNGEDCINFGSCGYLGIEFDEDVKKAAMEAIQQFGTQFAFPPIYLKTYLYEELESLYKKIFGPQIVIASSTTLAHFAAIPLICSDYADIIILDHQVHNSVKIAVSASKTTKNSIKTIPHNRLDMLESILKLNHKKRRRVWYFMDGVYSMHGDFCPIKSLQNLQTMYDGLHLYIDDAHGTSWTGKYGSGYALSQLHSLDRIVVTTSHAKGFGSGGGTLIIGDSKLYGMVKNYGPSMIFSGPMQPAILGASIASAKIHLSTRFPQMQTELMKNIQYRNHQAIKHNLPVIGPWESPIMFLGLGHHVTVGNLVRALRSAGFYVNAAMFPAVAQNHNGIRITTTRLQEKNDIDRLFECVENVLPSLLFEQRQTIESIKDRFKI